MFTLIGLGVVVAYGDSLVANLSALLEAIGEPARTRKLPRRVEEQLTDRFVPEADTAPLLQLITSLSRGDAKSGLGAGLSYSEQISQMELRDQAKHDRGNWKLLNYMDPSIDFRVGRETYLGVGVSHRSGEFGKSQFFGNVNGGSNYIYVSIETTLR